MLLLNLKICVIALEILEPVNLAPNVNLHMDEMTFVKSWQKKKKEEKFPKAFVDSFSPVENVSGTNLNVPIRHDDHHL